MCAHLLSTAPMWPPLSRTCTRSMRCCPVRPALAHCGRHSASLLHRSTPPAPPWPPCASVCMRRRVTALQHQGRAGRGRAPAARVGQPQAQDCRADVCPCPVLLLLSRAGRAAGSYETGTHSSRSKRCGAVRADARLTAPQFRQQADIKVKRRCAASAPMPRRLCTCGSETCRTSPARPTNSILLICER